MPDAIDPRPVLLARKPAGDATMAKGNKTASQAAMAEHAFALDASGLSTAGATFWTAWHGITSAGFGGLKQLDCRHGDAARSGGLALP
jgi:hypothetical protein